MAAEISFTFEDYINNATVAASTLCCLENSEK